jgi:hypothetical protein
MCKEIANVAIDVRFGVSEGYQRKIPNVSGKSYSPMQSHTVCDEVLTTTTSNRHIYFRRSSER